MKAAVVSVLERGFLWQGRKGRRGPQLPGFPPCPLLTCLPVHRDTHPPPQGLQHPQSKCHPVPCQFHRCRRWLPSLQVCPRLGRWPPEASKNTYQNLIRAEWLGPVSLDLGQAVVWGRVGSVILGWNMWQAGWVPFLGELSALGH